MERGNFDSDASYQRYMELQSKIEDTQKKIDDLKPWFLWRIFEALLDKLFSSDGKK